MQLLNLDTDLLVSDFHLGFFDWNSFQCGQVEFRPYLNLEIELQRSAFRQLYVLEINIRITKDVQLVVLDG